MDPSVKTTIEQRLVETGEKERLKEHLRLIVGLFFPPAVGGLFLSYDCSWIIVFSSDRR